MPLTTAPSRGSTIDRMIALAFGVIQAGVVALVVLTLSKSEFYIQLLLSGLTASGWNRPVSFGMVAVVIVLIALTLWFTLKELRVTLRRWRQREPEPDVPLRAQFLACVALVCILVNVFLLSTAESIAGPFRLRSPVLGSVSAILAYGVYVYWYSRLPRLRQVLSRNQRRGLQLIAWNLALLLVLGEISLRVLATYWGAPILVTETMPSQVRRGANRQAPGTPYLGFPINSGGHYDGEFVPNSDLPGPLVISIGDSFSYGVVPLPYHFTTVAERLSPGIEIYNMGFSAIGPTDYLYLMESEALPLDPDLIVIQLYLGNDITEGAALAGPPRWYDADSYLLAIVWHRLKIMQQAELTNADNAVPDSSAVQDLLSAYPFLDNPLLETPSMVEDAFFAFETSTAKDICVPDDELYERFFSWIEDIQHAAGDTPLKFVLIPDEFQVEDYVWTEILRRTDKQLDRDLPQRRIVKWMESRGLPVLDLLPLLRSVEPMTTDGYRHLYHARNLHFNARGNEIAGQALARFVGTSPGTAPHRVAFKDDAANRWLLARGWTPDQEIAMNELPAAEILKQLGETIAKNGLDGNTVLDTALLAHSEKDIMSAIALIIESGPEDQAAFARSALPALAFFQPGVGDDPRPIDSPGPNGEPWRKAVEVKMQGLAK